MTNQIEAFGLIARLKDDNLQIMDAETGEVIYDKEATKGQAITITKRMRLRKKQADESKMTSLLEGMVDEPRLEHYF